MGGRGQNYSVVKRLPNYRRAFIPRNKLKNYILNPSKDKNKAEFFSSLGYNMKNWKRLERDILHKASTNKALKYKKDEYGRVAYQVNMLLGISRKRMVATGWIIDKKGDNPRMITAYHNQKLKQAYREK